MSWLNPIALWGLTALAIPILIHFWSKNKTKEIAFGSIQFLRESSTLQSKKIQLSEIPLLILRFLILTLVVLLIAKWVNYQEVDRRSGILLGDEIQLPEAFSNEEYLVFKTSQFGKIPNHWHLLQEFSSQQPEIDSLIYINDFTDQDFIGAIPQLNFNLELISKNQSSISPKIRSLDTLLIHFDKVPESVKEKFDKVLETNELYLNGKLKINISKKVVADLIFSTLAQKSEANQIVLSDTISTNYLIQKNHFYSTLYLKGDWIKNPLNEDMFLSIVTEFIGQIIEPNWQYSSFDRIYSREIQAKEKLREAQTYDIELLWLIVVLIMVERYFSYRKKNA